MPCRHEPTAAEFASAETRWRSARANNPRPTTYVDVGVSVNLDFQISVLHASPEKYCEDLIASVNDIYQHATPQFEKWSGMTASEIENDAHMAADVSQAVQQFLTSNVADRPRIRLVLREVNYRPDMGDYYLDAGNPAQVEELKQTRFPRNSRNYLPIWITRLLNGELGFARFPFSGSWLDYGVVIDVGTTMAYLASPALLYYSSNRTLAHELGHAMGLFHTFTAPNLPTQSGLGRLDDPQGNGSSDPQNVLGDGAADTPMQQSATQGNPFQLRSTSVHNSLGQVVMFVNFMDYTDDAAMLTLTRDQCARIDYFLREDVVNYVDSVRDTNVTSYASLRDPVETYGPVHVNRLIGNGGSKKAGVTLNAPTVAGIVLAVALAVLIMSLGLVVHFYSRKFAIGQRSHQPPRNH